MSDQPPPLERFIRWFVGACPRDGYLLLFEVPVLFGRRGGVCATCGWQSKRSPRGIR
jgi:hypothetical protein